MTKRERAICRRPNFLHEGEGAEHEEQVNLFAEVGGNEPERLRRGDVDEMHEMK